MVDTTQFKENFLEALKALYGKPVDTCSKFEQYTALVRMISTTATVNRSITEEKIRRNEQKKVFYFSMEFLIGKLLENYLYTVGIYNEAETALNELGINLRDLLELEPEPGLGNGGLGRLAACFLDSMASLGIAGEGIGLRYRFGLFRQSIVNGRQVELPDPWLENGYPWEISNPDDAIIVKYGGYVERNYINGKMQFEHKNYQTVSAVPYDVPIIGEEGKHIGVLHLYDARPEKEHIDMDAFNKGDYALAMKEKCEISAMTSILYPDDSNGTGKKLRLRQEYLLVAAGLGNILHAYTEQYGHNDWFALPDRISIHINDTHPTLCIPELMRILIDDEGLEWNDAWDITMKTISFTNHTVLPEALEKWPIDLFQSLLPRVYMIVEEIDRRFREYMNSRGLSSASFLKKTCVLWDGQVRMANLSIIGSHSTNGVAALHTQILKDDVFRSFYELFPERFNNKTNGISHRRFLIQANPELGKVLSDVLGADWIHNINRLGELENHLNDPEILSRLRQVKYNNKLRLSEYLEKTQGISLNPNSVFDVQVKRIHAYKRQLLFALKIMYVYNRLVENPYLDIQPYTFIFAGKAAQGYFFAKEVIYLINTIAQLVNNDSRVNQKIKVVFVENFCTSNAQLIYPAADISEQISTAGKEASGTGNMKFMMNGAVTLGTLDGANVEIKEHVGDDNIVIFGLKADEAMNYYTNGGYDPRSVMNSDPRLNKIMTQLVDGTLRDSNGAPVSFWSIYSALAEQGDEYFVLKDFDSYVSAWEYMDKIYADKDRWGRMSLMNIARSPFFSSDRTIAEYADEIWHTEHR
ncbi:MAG: glycogen/starch/alpha-glucan phosphorylase [Parasporobacterium sp.]|nr:glycogen/starch/alpha-glucan phosphorylase [Parasporobacterium sp.]